MSYYLFQSLKSKVALYYFCWKSFEPYEFENKAWNKMKSVKYPDASLKKFFSLNPAVLFFTISTGHLVALLHTTSLYSFEYNDINNEQYQP